MSLGTKTRLPTFSGQVTAVVPTPTFSGLLTDNASDSINPYTSQGPGEGGAGQTYDDVYVSTEGGANTALLLNFEGTNGATSTTDASSNGYAITFNGAAQISTAQKKFGSSSLYIPSAGDIRFSAEAMNVALTDFTWEGWIYPTTASGDRHIFTGRVGGGVGNVLFRVFNGVLGVLIDLAPSSGWNIIQQSAGSPTVNAWNHVALDRYGSALSVYLNGTRTMNTTISGSISDSTTGGCIGSDNSGDYSPSWVGYMDSIRFTNGESIYQNAATISVPTTAFSS